MTFPNNERKTTPSFYLCKFEIELSEELGPWELNVYRYNSLIALETIELVQLS
jgi:hypothetical protein